MDQKVFNEAWHQTIERLVEDLKWPLNTQNLFPVSKLSPIVSTPLCLVELTDERGGWGRSQITRQRECLFH
jgi:hypothetical protein